MSGRRGETWNDEDIATLREMARAGHSLLVIARKLERTQEAVAGKARRLGVALAQSQVAHKPPSERAR